MKIQSFTRLARGFSMSFALAALLALGCRMPPAQELPPELPPEPAGPFGVSFNASSGSGSAPAAMIWTGGAGLTLPDQGEMTNDSYFFCGWAEESENGKYAASPYVPNTDVTLFAVWRDITAIIAAYESKMAACTRVIGNPADNSAEALAISNTAAELTALMQGTDATRTINTDGGDTVETYKVYDYPAIYEKSMTLDALSSTFSGGEIIVESMYFQYIKPTTAEQSPKHKATLRTAGVYEIELAGAAGGHVWTNVGKTGTGGKGGHIKGEYNVSADTSVDIRVGGQGRGLASYDAETNKYKSVYPLQSSDNKINFGVSVDGLRADQSQPGGYNGGGSGGAGIGSWGAIAGLGGGGATDVRLAGNTAALTGISGTDPRIAVAGGGGGAAQSSLEGNVALKGGNSGGTTGSDGVADTAGNKPKGGTQSNGGTQPSNCNPGTAGNGRNGGNGVAEGGNAEGRSGGGGGWWGGGALTNANNNTRPSSGAGGSSYTGGASGITPVGTPVNETISGNVWGDGWAKITWKR